MIKAIDQIDAEATELAAFYQEAMIMKACKHPGVAKVIEVIENSSNLFIVTQLYEGADLFSWMEAQSEEPMKE